MWDRVERLIGKDNLTLLSQKRVGVVGLGSGGGFVAQSLAMSGVGHFVLIDDDTLEETNIVRHVADRRYLGQPKVDAVADIIRQRNPQASVITYNGRIEQHLDALDGLDLLIVGVDGEQVKYIINQACLERDLVAIYAGVYEKGEGGDVVIIYPYDGPCYACWSAAVRDEVQLINEAGELDYGMIGPEGTIEAEPALWLHVVRVALTQADFAIKFLLRETDHYSSLPANTIILANNVLEILTGQETPPHSALWIEVERDPHCLVCGDQMQRNATYSQMIKGISLQDLADETGISVESDD
jgi:molybdopterin/thiamine biosynthesis adenylyltransferase